MIDTNLELRVVEKRNIFIDKLKDLNLNNEQMTHVEELANDMEYCNRAGEKELAKECLSQIKKYLKECLQ